MTPDPQSKTARAGAWLFQTATRHPYITLAIAAGLFYLLILFGPAFVLGIREGFSNAAIQKTKIEAATEKTAADQEKISAGQTEIERKAEDLNREQSLTPKRQQTATTLAEATQRRRAAEDRYEKSRNDRRHPDLDDLTLRRRNCSDLAELYPGQRFAGCN
jgi:hypothetical protein